MLLMFSAVVREQVADKTQVVLLKMFFVVTIMKIDSDSDSDAVVAPAACG